MSVFEGAIRLPPPICFSFPPEDLGLAIFCLFAVATPAFAEGPPRDSFTSWRFGCAVPAPACSLMGGLPEVKPWALGCLVAVVAVAAGTYLERLRPNAVVLVAVEGLVDVILYRGAATLKELR